MEFEPLKRFLLTRRRRSNSTVNRIKDGLRRLERKQLNWTVFAKGREHANNEAEAYLSRLLGNGCTPFQYNNDLAVMKAVADYYGFKLDLEYQEVPKTPPRTLKPEQLRKLLSYRFKGDKAENRLRRAIAVLIRYTGLRPSESRRLEVNDLDPHRSTVKIRLSSKRGISGEIPVPRSLWRPRGALMAYLRHRPQDKGPKLWVDNGGPLGEERYSHLLTEMSKELGFRVTHTFLRHTIATELHRKGLDVAYIRLFLRHKRITSTLVYVESSHDDLIREFQKIGK